MVHLLPPVAGLMGGVVLYVMFVEGIAHQNARFIHLVLRQPWDLSKRCPGPAVPRIDSVGHLSPLPLLTSKEFELVLEHVRSQNLVDGTVGLFRLPLDALLLGFFCQLRVEILDQRSHLTDVGVPLGNFQPAIPVDIPSPAERVPGELDIVSDEFFDAWGRGKDSLGAGVCSGRCRG